MFNRGQALWRLPRKSLAKYRWELVKQAMTLAWRRRQRRLKHALAEV
jgi:hypothetical protein